MRLLGGLDERGSVDIQTYREGTVPLARMTAPTSSRPAAARSTSQMQTSSSCSPWSSTAGRKGGISAAPEQNRERNFRRNTETLDIGAGDSLTGAMEKTRSLPVRMTDCALDRGYPWTASSS